MSHAALTYLVTTNNSRVVFTDGTTTLSLQPKYNYKSKHELLRHQYRSRNGTLYSYRLGEFKAWRVPLSYVSSSDAYTINNWWETNTALSFTPYGSTDVTTVSIVNKEAPINTFMLPYDTLYQGDIEVEEF